MFEVKIESFLVETIRYYLSINAI